MGSMIVAAPIALGPVEVFAWLLIIVFGLPILLFSVKLLWTIYAEAKRVLGGQTMREQYRTLWSCLAWLALVTAAAVWINTVLVDKTDKIYWSRMLMLFCQLPFVLYCLTGRKNKALQLMQSVGIVGVWILAVIPARADGMKGGIWVFDDLYGFVIPAVILVWQVRFFRRNDPDWMEKQKAKQKSRKKPIGDGGEKRIIRRPEKDDGEQR